MKRRTFIKGLLGAGAVVSTPSLASKIADSMAKTRKTLAINIPPRNPEAATKYISGLYRKSHNPKMYSRRAGKTNFGYDEIRSKLIHPDEIMNDHYTISGEGKTTEEAWERFWMRFRGYTLNDGYDKDIFWRRVVEETENPLLRDTADSDYNAVIGQHQVRCRFSLGDIG